MKTTTLALASLALALGCSRTALQAIASPDAPAPPCDLARAPDLSPSPPAPDLGEAPLDLTPDAAREPTLELLAGQIGGCGSADDRGEDARFCQPYGMASDGTRLYVADVDNHRIRAIALATGEVTTVAGSVRCEEDHTGTQQCFTAPIALALDGAGSLYVGHAGGIRKLQLATGTITTPAFQKPANAWYQVIGLALDGAGHLYASDGSGVYRIAIGSGEVTTLVTRPTVKLPSGMVLDGKGHLLVADEDDCVIRSIDVATGELSTFFGTPGDCGQPDQLHYNQLDHPRDLTFDGDGNNLFVVERSGLARLHVTLAKYVDVRWPSLGDLHRVAYTGALYASDGATVRRLDPKNGALQTVAGRASSSPELLIPGPPVDGVGEAARFSDLRALVSDGAGTLYLGQGWLPALRKLTLDDRRVTTLAGDLAVETVGAIWGLTLDGVGHVVFSTYLTDGGVLQRMAITDGKVDRIAEAKPSGGVVSDGAGNFYFESGATIQRLVAATKEITTLAGQLGQRGLVDGVGAAARFGRGYSYLGTPLVLDGAGHLYVADVCAIRKLDLATGAVTTLAGQEEQGDKDGIGATAAFGRLYGMTIDRSGHLFVSDTDNYAIRRVDVATGEVRTVIGQAGRMGVKLGHLPAGLSLPTGIAWLPGGDLAITDNRENAVLLAHLGDQ